MYLKSFACFSHALYCDQVSHWCLSPLQICSMVVPDSATVVPHPDRSTGLPESSGPGCTELEETRPDLAAVELEEVRKLQELVRRLEIQNETLRSRGVKTVTPKGAISDGVNINQRLQLRLDHGAELSSMGSKLSPPQEGSSSEEVSPSAVANHLEEEDEDLGPLCGGFLSLTCRNGAEQAETPESPSQGSCESETLADSDSGVDHTALDEVDVLDLQAGCAEVEDEDSW